MALVLLCFVLSESLVLAASIPVSSFSQNLADEHSRRYARDLTQIPGLPVVPGQLDDSDAHTIPVLQVDEDTKTHTLPSVVSLQDTADDSNAVLSSDVTDGINLKDIPDEINGPAKVLLNINDEPKDDGMTNDETDDITFEPENGNIDAVAEDSDVKDSPVDTTEKEIWDENSIKDDPSLDDTGDSNVNEENEQSVDDDNNDKIPMQVRSKAMAGDEDENDDDNAVSIDINDETTDAVVEKNKSEESENENEEINDFDDDSIDDQGQNEKYTDDSDDNDIDNEYINEESRVDSDTSAEYSYDDDDIDPNNDDDQDESLENDKENSSETENTAKSDYDDNDVKMSQKEIIKENDDDVIGDVDPKHEDYSNEHDVDSKDEERDEQSNEQIDFSYDPDFETWKYDNSPEHDHSDSEDTGNSKSTDSAPSSDDSSELPNDDDVDEFSDEEYEEREQIGIVRDVDETAEDDEKASHEEIIKESDDDVNDDVEPEREDYSHEHDIDNKEKKHDEPRNERMDFSYDPDFETWGYDNSLEDDHSDFEDDAKNSKTRNIAPSFDDSSELSPDDDIADPEEHEVLDTDNEYREDKDSDEFSDEEYEELKQIGVVRGVDETADDFFDRVMFDIGQQIEEIKYRNDENERKSTYIDSDDSDEKNNRRKYNRNESNDSSSEELEEIDDSDAAISHKDTDQISGEDTDNEEHQIDSESSEKEEKSDGENNGKDDKYFDNDDDTDDKSGDNDQDSGNDNDSDGNDDGSDKNGDIENVNTNVDGNDDDGLNASQNFKITRTSNKIEKQNKANTLHDRFIPVTMTPNAPTWSTHQIPQNVDTARPVSNSINNIERKAQQEFYNLQNAAFQNTLTSNINKATTARSGSKYELPGPVPIELLGTHNAVGNILTTIKNPDNASSAGNKPLVSSTWY